LKQFGIDSCIGKYYNHCCVIAWQGSNEHCLKKLMDLDWPYEIEGKNSSFYMLNTFLEAYLNFQISWHLQQYYEKLLKSLYFNWLRQASTEYYLKWLMNFNWTYQNWGGKLYSYVNHILGSITKISNKLAVTVVLCKIL